MFEENQEMFLSMYSDMREAKASMLQDLEKGKLSEVNQINGFVSSIGKKHGIRITSYNVCYTKLLRQLIPLRLLDGNFFLNW